jgi:hypothetical protein
MEVLLLATEDEQWTRSLWTPMLNSSKNKTLLEVVVGVIS